MHRCFRCGGLLAGVLAAFLATTARANAASQIVNVNATAQLALVADDISPILLHVGIDGNGVDPTLGPFTLHEDGVLNVQTHLFTGSTTYTLASGERLFGTSRSTFGNIFSETTIFTSGTGRLKKAAGAVVVTLVGDPNNGSHPVIKGALITPNR
jgi:hypothetical protein